MDYLMMGSRSIKLISLDTTIIHVNQKKKKKKAEALAMK